MGKIWHSTWGHALPAYIGTACTGLPQHLLALASTQLLPGLFLVQLQPSAALCFPPPAAVPAFDLARAVLCCATPGELFQPGGSYPSTRVSGISSQPPDLKLESQHSAWGQTLLVRTKAAHTTHPPVPTAQLGTVLHPPFSSRIWSQTPMYLPGVV